MHIQKQIENYWQTANERYNETIQQELMGVKLGYQRMAELPWKKAIRKAENCFSVISAAPNGMFKFY